MPTDAISGAHDAFIAADVGGTHVRIGLVRGSGDAGTPVHVLEYRKYACAEHAGLGDIVQDFLAHLSLDHGRVTRGVIASAGYALEDGTVMGEIVAVPNFGAGDLLELRVAESGETRFIPFTKLAVPEVNLADGYVVVVPPVEIDREAEDAPGADEDGAP